MRSKTAHNVGLPVENDFFLSLPDSLIRLEPEVSRLCLEGGIILDIADSKVKERLLRENELSWSFSQHERFLMFKLRM